jgi:MFS family permease
VFYTRPFPLWRTPTGPITGLSIHQAALYVGVMSSGFLGGFIADRWGWRSAFYGFGGCGIVLGALLIWRLKAPSAGGEKTSRVCGETENWRVVWGVFFRTRTALLLTVGCAAIIFVNNAYVVWAPEFVREKFSLTQAAAGGYALFYPI